MNLCEFYTTWYKHLECKRTKKRATWQASILMRLHRLVISLLLYRLITNCVLSFYWEYSREYNRKNKRIFSQVNTHIQPVNVSNPIRTKNSKIEHKANIYFQIVIFMSYTQSPKYHHLVALCSQLCIILHMRILCQHWSSDKTYQKNSLQLVE